MANSSAVRDSKIFLRSASLKVFIVLYDFLLPAELIFVGNWMDEVQVQILEMGEIPMKRQKMNHIKMPMCTVNKFNSKL